MQAFILRITPAGVDRVPEALDANQIMIGWSEAVGLLNPDLGWEEFRQIVREAYYRADETWHRAGTASGHIWRFTREMQLGDLVVVPYGPNFYVARVTGEAVYLHEKALEEDSAYRRPVEWLNEKRPIPRALARSPLISRMKIHGTSASATDLVDEIQECLRLAATGEERDFRGDLQLGLANQALHELRSGRLDSYGFEHLIRSFLKNVGASEARIVPRSQDKGADIVATFRLVDTFQFVVAVQAKHYLPEPPVGREAVDQLISGMDAEGADLGMVVTTGSFSQEALEAAEQYGATSGNRIELVDGEQFSKMLVEHGTRN